MSEPTPPPPPWDPTRIRGVVFDLDGTLVDSYVAIALSLNHAREQYGKPALPNDEVRRRVGRGLECLIADELGPDHVADGVRLFRERYAEVYLEHTVLLPHVAGTLERLAKDGFGMVVASNKPARFTRPILEQLGVDQAFNAVLGPDIVGTAKPEPTMLRRSVEALKLDAQTTLYVGDMTLDAESAANAGLPVVLVCGGSSPRDELEQLPHPVLGDLRELPPLLHGCR